MHIRRENSLKVNTVSTPSIAKDVPLCTDKVLQRMSGVHVSTPHTIYLL